MIALAVVWLGLAGLCFAAAALEVTNAAVAGLEATFYAVLRHVGAFAGTAGLACLATGAIPRRFRIGRALQSAVANASLVLGGIAVALVVLEAVLHWRYHDVQIGGDDSPSRYTFYPKYYHRNPSGYRDAVHSIAKPADTIRVMVVGDSFTFGAGVKRIDDLYFRVLERELARAFPDLRFETYSVARKGWNTVEEFAAVRQYGIRFDPDVAVLSYVLNDAESPALRQLLRDSYREVLLLPPPYGEFLHATSFLFYILGAKLAGNAWLGTDSADAAPRYDVLYERDNRRRQEGILRDFYGYLRSRGVPIVVLMFPSLSDLQKPEYPYLRVHRFVERVARENGAAYVDLYEPLMSSGLASFTVSDFDGHPNEAVHRIAAESLVDVFRACTAARGVPQASLCAALERGGDRAQPRRERP